MSKAVLVIDMPEKCDDCPYADLIMGDCEAFAVLRHAYTYELPDDGEPRPEYCPLKPLPKKKPSLDEPMKNVFWEGYNKCIDDILEVINE